MNNVFFFFSLLVAAVQKVEKVVSELIWSLNRLIFLDWIDEMKHSERKETALKIATQRVLPSKKEKIKSLEGTKIFLVHSSNHSERDILSAKVVSLGGQVTKNLQEATHAVLVSGDTSSSTEMVDTAACAQALDVPIVSNLWLNRMASLEPEKHWSEIDVSEFCSNSRQETTNSIQLRDSITETWQYLRRESPDALEEDEIRRAIELSMLDCALCVRPRNTQSMHHKLQKTPQEILGIQKGASAEQIRAAFRKRAKDLHPDRKGGNARDFDELVRAYRTLLEDYDENDDAPLKLWLTDAKTTEQRDFELKEHRSLIHELFQNHGANLSSNINKQKQVLYSLGLNPFEAGASIADEQGNKLTNCCFYLSLATAYLTGLQEKNISQDLDLRKQTALRLKRVIESSVVRSHPEWANKIGDDIQAFSDFLVYALDNPTLADWAVVVFDSISGFVEIYKGKRYDDIPTPEEKRSSCLTIFHVPGHYQPLLPQRDSELISLLSSDATISSSINLRPTLEEILGALEKCGVLFVVTEA
uniref:J domain-containing protein n=1 Tax=Aureoumbra lagunensis TaxID=44058 RepID=A0A7S3JZX2_9STRA|mmetsp:Transcript_11856/g.17751  ORF Transcript_11856/g.17751 Transcript_11856/m.17751 type:complete len:531 (+) Transcript_11856:2-1594(+)